MDIIIFNKERYHHINTTVVNNARRGGFVDGEIGTVELDYHIIGIGCAAISLSFDKCSPSTSIEFDFSQVLRDKYFQVSGFAPRKRNMMRSLSHRSKKIGQRW